ncbi:MAG: protein-export membrane protein SecD [Bdellovibrionales bacterium RBG_16_40_8]|nr:MAG: protein-export membrane protein SecD [Bdellovibrionales bacterium RBG_16_40_8]
MLSGLRGRWIVIIITIVIGALWLTPNFIKYDKDSFLGKKKMILGLDIQGGLHLVMGVDVDSVVQERTSRQAKDLGSQFATDGIKVISVNVVGDNKTKIEIRIDNGASKDAVVKYIDDRQTARLQVVSADNERVLLQYFDADMIDMKKQIISQAIEVIRNRIDEFGVAEPNISAQGSDRILVQLPGVKDAVRAKELINRTAKLDFRIVSQEIPLDKLSSMIDEAEKKGNYKLGENDLGYAAYVKKINEDLQSQLSKNSKIVFEKIESAASLEVGKRPYVVLTDSQFGGDKLDDAFVRNDQFNKPEVIFSFSIEGRKLFAEITSKAAGGAIAIILDDIVQTAPNVERQIDSDSAVITLGMRDFKSAQNEASLIAMALRAGSLPAALQQLEERTVGPSLGGDSVEKAKMASIVGCLAVFIFMFLYYSFSGLVADLALLLNVFFTFAILTSLGATLTLPGVAGIALTVGIAVDANIIIFERIKEELRKGASQVSALKDGFSHAFSAIVDSNLTMVLTCLVLMYYGTGPVRGFAVTLTIGITCSMFTAVFVTRTILDTLVHKMKMNIFVEKKG